MFRCTSPGCSPIQYIVDRCPTGFTPDGVTRAGDPLLLYFTSGTTAASATASCSMSTLSSSNGEIR